MAVAGRVKAKTARLPATIRNDQESGNGLRESGGRFCWTCRAADMLCFPRPLRVGVPSLRVAQWNDTSSLSHGRVIPTKRRVERDASARDDEGGGKPGSMFPRRQASTQVTSVQWLDGRLFLVALVPLFVGSGILVFSVLIILIVFIAGGDGLTADGAGVSVDAVNRTTAPV